MDTQIQVYDKINDMPAITELGRAIAMSGMFGCKRVEQGTIFALQCIAERKPPLEMAKTYHVINDKLAKRADAMLADFRRSGGKWAWADLDNTTQQQATVEWEGQTHTVTYTIEQAAQAELIKDGSAWKKDPAPMLRARLVSRTLRAIAPELVMGVYTTDELHDVQAANAAPEIKQVTPERVQATVVSPQTQKPQDEPARAVNDDPFTRSSSAPVTVEAEAADVVDPDIVPIGKNKGKRWTELPHETLQKVIANPGPLTAAQLAAAQAALETNPF